MSDFSEFQLNKTVETTRSRQQSLPSAILFVTSIAAAAGFIIYLFVAFRHHTPSNLKPHTEQAVAPTNAAARPQAEAADTIDLPPLAETDSLVRELVARLSSHPAVARWLTTDELIKNFTVSVVNIAGGQSPARHLQKLSPTGTFHASSRGGISYVDPRSYQRYDGYADAVAALDARGAARLYATLKPRIQDAARELGVRDDFDLTMQRAIAEVLATPIVEGPIAITPAPVLWAYGDRRLESLSSAQRHLLRMGPRNVRLIQSKLREIAPHLGIQPQ